MKTIWRIIRICMFVLVILIGFCVFAEATHISLIKLQDRPYTRTKLSKSSKEYIESMTVDCESSIDIIHCCNDMIRSHLSFAQKNDIAHRKANCVGYAKYTADVMNYAFKVNHINDYAKPVVGHVILGWTNLNKLLTAIVPKKYKNFIKDHDFVETSEYYFDPTLYDFGLGDCITTKH